MKETIDIREQHLMRQLNLGTTAVVDEQGSNDLLDVLPDVVLLRAPYLPSTAFFA
jgi:hypothetical protein